MGSKWDIEMFTGSNDFGLWKVKTRAILIQQKCFEALKGEAQMPAGGSYNDERWAWMQTEVQRISTEQQSQGVEMAGLRNDVQRGNRINEENNQMIRNMMQHFHLQGPAYGPQ